MLDEHPDAPRRLGVSVGEGLVRSLGLQELLVNLWELIVIMELHVQPGDLGQLPCGVHGARVVPVDERDGSTLASQDVPGAEVAVADDRPAAGKRACKPRLPPGLGRRIEARRGGVQFPEDRADLGHRLVVPGEGLRALPLDEGQGLTPAGANPAPTTRGASSKPTSSR